MTIDKEKVIKGLECCSKGGCVGCPYGDDCETNDNFVQLAKDALELLEQEPMQMKIAMDYGSLKLELLKEQEKLVHCKDCKYSTNYSAVYDVRPYRCVKHYWFRDANYFCADGERR